MTYRCRLRVSAIFIDGTNDRLYVADQAGNAIAVYDHASTLNRPYYGKPRLQGVKQYAFV